MTHDPSLSISPAELHAKLIAFEADDDVFRGGVDFASSFTDAHLTYVDPETGRTLLHAVALGARTHAFRWFIDLVAEHGPEEVFALLPVETADKDGFTPLMHLAQRLAEGRKTIPKAWFIEPFITLLAENGADLDRTFPNGETPLETISVTFPGNRTFAACMALATLVAKGARFHVSDAKPCAIAAMITLNDTALGIVDRGLTDLGFSLRDVFGKDHFYEALVIIATHVDSYSSRPEGSPFSMIEGLGIDISTLDVNNRSIISIAQEIGVSSRTLSILRSIVWSQTSARVLA